MSDLPQLPAEEYDMAKTKNKQQSLAEWCEQMSRHELRLAAEADRKQRARSLTFKSKQHARIATLLRSILENS